MVAMHRQLPKEHPIHVLLEPHVEGTAFINWGAQEVWRSTATQDALIRAVNWQDLTTTN